MTAAAWAWTGYAVAVWLGLSGVVAAVLTLRAWRDGRLGAWRRGDR